MYWYLLLFLIVMFMLSQKEGFSSHNVIGPEYELPPPDDPAERKHILRDKNRKEPKLYDPIDRSRATPSNMGPTSDFNPDQAPPDDGLNSSDTTTQQNAIYFFKPFASLPFPKSEGPPVPFLNDFKVFQK